MTCDRCGASLTSQEAVCGSCGRMRPEGSGVECEQHVGVHAIACCFICGKPLCGDCATWTGSSFLCDMPAHQELAKGWTIVGSCATVLEADMLSTNLRQAGFSPMTFSPGEFAASYWHPELSTARVLVKKGDYDSARALLESLGFVENL